MVSGSFASNCRCWLAPAMGTGQRTVGPLGADVRAGTIRRRLTAAGNQVTTVAKYAQWSKLTAQPGQRDAVLGHALEMAALARSVPELNPWSDLRHSADSTSAPMPARMPRPTFQVMKTATISRSTGHEGSGDGSRFPLEPARRPAHTSER